METVKSLKAQKHWERVWLPHIRTFSSDKSENSYWLIKSNQETIVKNKPKKKKTQKTQTTKTNKILRNAEMNYNRPQLDFFTLCMKAMHRKTSRLSKPCR